MFTITNGIILKGQDLTLTKENIVVDDGIIPVGLLTKIHDLIPSSERLGDIILHKNMPQALAEDQGAVDACLSHFMIERRIIRHHDLVCAGEDHRRRQTLDVAIQRADQRILGVEITCPQLAQLDESV